MEKSADPRAYNAAGDVITYSFTVTNDGNVTLDYVSVSDPLDGLSAITPASVASLAPDATATFTATYTITQADVDEGEVKNTATASGTDPNDQSVTDTDDETISADQDPSITLVKSADPLIYYTAGDEITYTFTVTNDGNVTLTGVSITEEEFTGSDDFPALSFVNSTEGSPEGTLLPGEVATYEATYTTTEDDVEAGEIENKAKVTALDPNNDEVTDEDDATVNLAEITLTKAAAPQTYSAVDEEITYTITAENTGTASLTGVDILDELDGLSDLVCNLIVGAEDPVSVDLPLDQPFNSEDVLECTATYNVTQDDLDDGSVVNTASATGYAPGDDPQDDPTVTASDDETVTADQNAAIEILKTSTTDPNTYSAVGDVLTYDLVVTNTGNVTLTNIVVSDPDATVTGSPIAELAPGADTTVTAQYTITQDDLDRGFFTNEAEATGNYTDENDDPQTATDSDEETVTGTQLAEIEIVKTSTTVPNSYSAVGDVLTYDLVVTNTGNVTLTNIVVSDPDATVTGSPIASLAPGADTTVTAEYIVTQADLDRGFFTNEAEATGNYTDKDGETQSVTDDDDATVDADQNPSIVLDKSANPQTYDAAGDVITYTFTVENTGNVTLYDVSVSDLLPGLSAITPASVASLAPDATATFTATYTITQADVDEGEVKNTATASGTDPNDQSVTDTDDETISADQDPSITLVKSADPLIYYTAGDEITYTFTVTNDGNVTLTNMRIDDDLTGSADLEVMPSILAPGDTGTASATYIITQDDMNLGYVENTATAKGTDPNDQTVTASDDETITANQDPSIALVKEADTKGPMKANDEINYTITATNTGNVTLTEVVVLDDMIDLTCDPGLPAVLDPEDQTVCTGTYTVTQDDVRGRKPIENTASVSGEDSNGEQVEDQDDISIPVFIPAAAPIPTNTTWGLMIMMALFIISALYMRRRGLI